MLVDRKELASVTFGSWSYLEFEKKKKKKLLCFLAICVSGQRLSEFSDLEEKI